MILNEILENSVKHPNKNALTMKMGYRVHKFSYAQVYELAYKTALFLQSEGIKKGDKIIICAPNSPYWIILFWACQLIGAIVVPVNVQNTEEQIRKIIKQTEAKIIFKYIFFKANLENIKEFNIEYLENYIKNFNPEDFKPVEINEEDLVQILYTSGTTGDPKGVMLSHKNIGSNLEVLIKLIKGDLDGDRALSILPLSHIFEQVGGFLVAYSQGVEIVYAHSHGAIAELMQQYQITKMGVVPEFLHIFMSRLENSIDSSKLKFILKPLIALSSKINNKKISRILLYPVLKKMGKLDTFACGGAYLDPNLEKKWNNLGITILQGYGLTETSPVVSMNTFEETRLGSCGKVLENVQVKISEDKEILVKGPNVFKGYYKNEEKTKEVFTEDGWFKTGDLGEFDSDGFLYVRGRKKYMILSSGGQNVYPEDIETELNKNYAIEDSCVVGLDKPNGQVEIHASLLLKPGTKIKVEDIIQEANSHLASYQKITGWSVWPDLDFPRTVTRKVKKNDVIEWLKSNRPSEQTVTEKQDKLILILAKIAGLNPNKITNYTKIVNDLNFDSLMRVELVIWIEQELGTTIAESDIQPDTTVEELEKIIKSKKNSNIKEKLKQWPRSILARFVRAIIQPIIFFAAKIFIKLDVRGLENLKNLELPAIFMPNHTSYLDGLIVEMAIPRKIRNKTSFAGARDVLYEEFWYLTWLFEFLFNTFPLQRGDQANIKMGLEFVGNMLDNNYSVVLFPEGRMSRSGELQSLKGGAGLLAVEMAVPIVPVLIIGANDILPYVKVIPRKLRGKVTVIFGKPLTFDKSEPYEDASRKIHDAIKALQKF
ncbi:hypothetical protein A3F66_06880 [candidate division TM6 bacterium RIFCSPHIGHO2_12_FULL_32_22]|nr:MAG: hypothetical protein A3F66_06880 [candidate division TM6 bacterium RIFCSPHIGHO2_12_FULL_32_22]